MNIQQSAAMMARKGVESPLQVMFVEAASNSAVYFDDEMVAATPLCAMQGGDTVAVMFVNGSLYVVGNMTAMTYMRYYEYGFEYPESDYDSTTFGMTMRDGVLVPGINSNERPVVLIGSNAFADKRSMLEVGVGGTKVDGFKVPHILVGNGRFDTTSGSTAAVHHPVEFPQQMDAVPLVFMTWRSAYSKYKSAALCPYSVTKNGFEAYLYPSADGGEWFYNWMAVVL